MFKRLKKKVNNMPKAVVAGLVFLICSFLQKGVSTLTTPIFTRLLSTSEYGIYSVFVSWTSIFTIFITLRISSGMLQQSLVKHSEDKKEILSSMQGMSLFSCLIAIIIYFIYPNIWNNLTGMDSKLIIAMIIGIWATNVFEIWAQGKRTNYDYKLLALITIISTFLKPLLGIISILMFPEMKVHARIYSIVVVEIILYLGIFISQIRYGKLYSKKYWKYALTFNLPLLPHYLSLQVLSQTDRLMIDSLCGSDKAGIYSLAYQIAMVFTLFNSAMSSTLNPWIYNNIKKQKYERIEPVVNLLLVVLIGINIILILFAPEILKIFAPSTYYEAIWAIPAVTMSCIFMFLYGVFVCFEFYFEKKGYIAFASIIGAILNIGLNFLLIPRFGYIAASYTTLLCYILFCFLHYIFMKKVCKQQKIDTNIFNTRKLIIESFIFIILGLFIMLFYNNIYIRVIIFVMIVSILIINKNKIINIMKLLKNKS